MKQYKILTDGIYKHKLTVLSFWYSQGRNRIQPLFQMIFQMFFSKPIIHCRLKIIGILYSPLIASTGLGFYSAIVTSVM